MPVAVPTTMWSMLAAKTSIGAGLDTQGFESAKVAQGIESVCRTGTRPKLALEVFKAIAKQKVVSDAATCNAVTTCS